MKFAISSHKNYYSFTEKKIIESLSGAGIGFEDIYFFIGGYDINEPYKKLEGDYHRYSCPHNSIDFTGLVSVVDLNIESDHWFLLHDTCFVGPEFYNLIKLYDYMDKDYVSLTNDLSMNMGSYKWDYILKNKDRILSYKNVSEDVQEFKIRLIHEEDVFFNPRVYCYNNRPRQVSKPIDYYNNQTERIVEYFPGIDLHKVKANWFLKSIYVNKP